MNYFFFFFSDCNERDMLCMLQGFYLVYNPKLLGISTGKTFFLFQRLMILFSGFWILEEALFQRYNPVRPRKIIWEFSGYSRDTGRVIFQWKVEKSTGWKKQQDLNQVPLAQFCSAVNSMLSLLSFLLFVMTLYFLE